MKRFTAMVLGTGFLASAAFAAEPAKNRPAMPSVPAEVRKTVSAFLGFSGTWEATLRTPDGKSDTFALTFRARKTAAGRAVVGNGVGTSKVFGPWEGACLAGWDTGRKDIHFMTITSDGDVHDHRCQWEGDGKITCVTLKQPSADGTPVSEDLAFTLAGGKIIGFSSKTTPEKGGLVEFSAKRKTAKR